MFWYNVIQQDAKCIKSMLKKVTHCRGPSSLSYLNNLRHKLLQHDNKMLTTSNKFIIANLKKNYSNRTQPSDNLHTCPAHYSKNLIMFHHWINLNYLTNNIKSIGLDVCCRNVP
jgi:hypothetical protein